MTRWVAEDRALDASSAGQTSNSNGPVGRLCYGGQCASGLDILTWSAAQTLSKKEVARRAEQPHERSFKDETSVVYAIYVDRYKYHITPVRSGMTQEKVEKRAGMKTE